MNYDLLRGLHILAVIAWMAGIMYLPRLFAYHTSATRGSEMDETFQVMELKLYRIIMGPAMIAAWCFGILLIFTPNVVDWHSGWWRIADYICRNYIIFLDLWFIQAAVKILGSFCTFIFLYCFWNPWVL